MPRLNRMTTGAVALLLIAVSAPHAAAQQAPKPIENAMGVRTYGIMDCLTIPAVCEELKLTPDQLAALGQKAKEILAEFDPQEAAATGRENQHRALGYSPPDLEGLDRGTVFGFAMRRAAAAAREVLTEQQYERLVQINLQKYYTVESVPRVASDGYKEKLDARAMAEYEALQIKARRAKALLGAEHEFACRMGYRISVVDELVRLKTVEIDAAFYQRLLELMPREFRKRWHDHIGPVSYALKTHPDYRRITRDLYDVMLVADQANGLIPFDPYLDLPDGKTTGKDYEDFPRSKRKKR